MKRVNNLNVKLTSVLEMIGVARDFDWDWVFCPTL